MPGPVLQVTDRVMGNVAANRNKVGNIIEIVYINNKRRYRVRWNGTDVIETCTARGIKKYFPVAGNGPQQVTMQAASPRGAAAEGDHDPEEDADEDSEHESDPDHQLGPDETE